MTPPASLSLDLDDQWSYLRTHGDPEWKALPSYLEIFVPRLLRFLSERDLQITVFVVGQDAALESHREVFEALGRAGHEIGNHSYHHEPWLHLYSVGELEGEIERAEQAIESATGVRPSGFRAPGYSFTPATIEVLARRGYRYDASRLPTFLGPLARAYYFRHARLTPVQKRKRDRLFGGFREGLRPLRPYREHAGRAQLVEMPVTTMPILRTPIHLSYVLHLANRSPRLARLYFDMALTLCRWRGVEPSILLHPLDLMGCDDEGLGALAFFPGMERSRQWKLARVSELLSALTRHFRVLTLAQHLDDLEQREAIGREA